MGKKKYEINAEMGAASIINQIKKGRINSDRKKNIDSVFEELDQEKKRKIVDSVQNDPIASKRITYSGGEASGYNLYAVESGPRSKKPIGVAILAVVVMVVAFWAYSNFIQEHPMET